MATTTMLSGPSSPPSSDVRPGGEVNFGRVFAFGFAFWAIGFAVANGMYRWRIDNRPLFEAAIPVILALAATMLGSAYLVGVRKRFVAQGALIGTAWAALSILIDLPIFLAGPTRMTIGEYFQDIGVTYLMIPIITVGLAYQRGLGGGSRPA